MRKISLFLALAIVFSFSPMKQSPAQESGFKVAVIDTNRIVREGKAFQSIRAQIGKFRQTFQGEIQKEEEALRGADQELARQRTLLSAEAFDEKRREFQQRVESVQRLVQQRKQNLDRAQSQAMGKIQGELNQIVANVAKEQGVSLILRWDQIFLADKGLGITEEVLKRLDAKIPSIKVEAPAN